MSRGLDKNRPRLPLRGGVVIVFEIIGLSVVLSFFFSRRHEDASNVTGDTVPSTAVVTNFVSTLTVNHSVDFNHVHFTVTSVTQAAAFSDDRRRGGQYTVRVELQASSENGNQAPVGIDYPALARLLTPDGQVIAPKLVSIAPLGLPNNSQSGYLDVPGHT